MRGVGIWYEVMGCVTMYKVFPIGGIRTWGGGDARYNPMAFRAAVKKRKAYQPWNFRRLFRPKTERNDDQQKETGTYYEAFRSAGGLRRPPRSLRKEKYLNLCEADRGS